ncbi:Helix-turn-helix domain-containing protein [Nocardia amikacinitolerans]|uniref:helix-turn-helix transcriptional regulator n=1 Tax=Nocardia amikacinitolerans TaxID=756689 RepID=UPI000834BC1C|nr:helix-turn-helix transcriptional regulator [Nocardia amikacinitolerans]MCP2320092.1 Helix-turn-helix domain-containing protein [Nocardia amikacinitolerans]
MAAHPDLGAFLKSRRARITPAEAGLADGRGRRRVPGLRREELAQLASISVDYYIRFEQGRAGRVSDSVLDVIADVLHLDTDERDHLTHLARPMARPVTPPTPQRPHSGLLRVLSALDARPAFILGRRMEVLAWNAFACRLITDFDTLPARQRNLARLVLLDEKVQRLYPNRDLAVSNAVGYLRRDLGRHPGDLALGALVDELSSRSEEFREKWDQHTVRRKGHGIKQFDHPLVGEFELTYESVELPGEHDQVLVLYTADTGTLAATKLELLTPPPP